MEELFVAAASIAFGVLVLARVEPFTRRSGRFRRVVGVLAMVVGGALIVGTLVR